MTATINGAVWRSSKALDHASPSGQIITTNFWSSALAGGHGTVTVTTLTSTRIAGTFSFDAISNTASGTLQVRSGTFDLAF